ncbi:MAG: hypothetical protein QOG28_6988 [Trebonia sp.]|nr:hypothetical protein [Trebonia sp.]
MAWRKPVAHADHVRRLEGPVGHADAVRLDRGEHRVPDQGAALGGGPRVRGPRQAGVGDDGADGAPRARVRLDPGDGRPAGCLRRELPVDPRRLPAGDPGGRRHPRDLVKELDRGDAAADHDDMPAGELRRADVLRDVQLAAREALKAGVPGPVRRAPRAGGVDCCPGRPGAMAGLHEQAAAGKAVSGGTSGERAAGQGAAVSVAHGVHADGAQDGEAELPLVRREVAGHRVGGGLGGVDGRLRHAGKVEDPVHCRHPQGPPAVPPGAARRVLAVEHHVLQAAPAQVIGGRKPGLAGADDHHRH